MRYKPNKVNGQWEKKGGPGNTSTNLFSSHFCIPPLFFAPFLPPHSKADKWRRWEQDINIRRCLISLRECHRQEQQAAAEISHTRSINDFKDWSRMLEALFCCRFWRGKMINEVNGEKIVATITLVAKYWIYLKCCYMRIYLDLYGLFRKWLQLMSN